MSNSWILAKRCQCGGESTFFPPPGKILALLGYVWEKIPIRAPCCSEGWLKAGQNSAQSIWKQGRQTLQAGCWGSAQNLELDTTCCWKIAPFLPEAFHVIKSKGFVVPFRRVCDLSQCVCKVRGSLNEHVCVEFPSHVHLHSRGWYSVQYWFSPAVWRSETHDRWVRLADSTACFLIAKK